MIAPQAEELPKFVEGRRNVGVLSPESPFQGCEVALVENQGRVEVREFCWRQKVVDSARLVRCSSCAYATLVPILRRGLLCLVAAVGVLARQLANAPVRGGFTSLLWC